jgi:hypothetical protein
MLQDEICYPDPINESILDMVKGRITDKTGQVHFLLLKEPGTKGDNELLAGWYHVFFQHTHTYDPNTQSFIEKQGIKLSQMKYRVRQATLERIKRKLQEEDGLLYHKKMKDEKDRTVILEEWLYPHTCLRASSQHQLQSRVEYEISRKGWASNWQDPMAVAFMDK